MKHIKRDDGAAVLSRLRPGVYTNGLALVLAGALSIFVPNSARGQWSGGPSGPVYYNGGNVGIGTASPSYPLSVTGTAFVGNLYTANVTGGISVDGGQALQFQNSGGYLAIRNLLGGGGIQFRQSGDSATWMTILNTGNVGIGTMSPGVVASTGRTYLTVSGSTGAGMLEMVTQQADADGAVIGGIQFADRNSLSRAAGIFSLQSGTTANNRGGTLSFWTKADNDSALYERMRIDRTGNVGIGTTAPQYKLAVNGTVGAREVVVTGSGWADDVFRPDYRLRPLSDVADYISAHGHLPGIPTEADVREKGVGLGEMQVKLLAKIEELTLHLIESERRNRELETRVANLERVGGK